MRSLDLQRRTRGRQLGRPWLLTVAAAVFGGLLIGGAATALAEAVTVPANGVSLQVHFGLKDRAETDWSGQLRLSRGSVVGIQVVPSQNGTAEGNTWKVRTRENRKRRRVSIHDPVPPKWLRPSLLVTLDAPADATVRFQTPQGEFSLRLSELRLGQPTEFLQGQVSVELVPLSVQLTSGPEDEDWPDATRAADGTVWVVYTAYRHAGPLDAQAIHRTRDFRSLKPTGNGDQVRLVSFDGRRWSEPLNVTKHGLDVWRPSVAVDGRGTVWVVWSQQVDGNWDLYARGFQPSSKAWTPVVRLTEAAGADLDAEAVVSPVDGRVWVVWRGWRNGSFDILLTQLTSDGRSTGERAAAASPANEWWPAAVFDSKGRLVVAYDTYRRGNYDVELVWDAAGQSPQTVDVAATPLFEARPSLVVDRQDRVWVAFEQGGQQWGKDTGMRWRGRRGEQLYWQRDVVVRQVERGRLAGQAAGTVPAPKIKREYPVAETKRISHPRLALDDSGRLWLLFRRHPNTSGGGESWVSFVTYHDGDRWVEPVPLANSANLLDNRPAVLSAGPNRLLVVHSSDGRTRGTRSAKDNNLFCSLVRAGGDGLTARPARSPNLVALPPAPEPVPAVHPNENQDVQRIRNYRITVGGKTYQPVRGEFHRHTELTSHRDMDGTLQDMFRYALDVAQMDWIGNGDHDNGYGVEYLWWLVQKRTDMYHHPPRFMPMFTYERSVSYPSGHRNAMFAVRGIRPLPRMPGGRAALFGTPEKGAPDIKTFYAYLKYFDGICASHTSGTGMGTDWRDNDPEVEPVVEIYQGLRHSYEHQGAPATASGPADAIGGYRPAGFVWNALMKGYRLGFESSSDHYSTHISYAIAWAEERSRQGILDAFKKRHCYAANDNIILDVRCGEHLMGDVFRLKGKPTLDIHVIGTDRIERLSIIRGVGNDKPRYVYDGKPQTREVRLSWTDADAVPGKVNYYYVRVEQVIPEGGYGALAWSSPLWIRVEP